MEVTTFLDRVGSGLGGYTGMMCWKSHLMFVPDETQVIHIQIMTVIMIDTRYLLVNVYKAYERQV
jgi:hypothetical protein